MAAIAEPATESSPLGRVSPRQVIVLVVASAAMVAGLVVIAPAISDLPDVWGKLMDGHLGWLAFALGLEIMSFVGHAILFRAVSIDADGDALADRLPRQHRGHARRPRRHAPVRVGRRRRHRAHRVGAEEVRHGGA